MVKTELNIVEANLTRVCGVIFIDQSKKAGGGKPSVMEYPFEVLDEMK